MLVTLWGECSNQWVIENKLSVYCRIQQESSIPVYLFCHEYCFLWSWELFNLLKIVDHRFIIQPMADYSARSLQLNTKNSKVMAIGWLRTLLIGIMRSSSWNRVKLRRLWQNTVITALNSIGCFSINLGWWTNMDVNPSCSDYKQLEFSIVLCADVFCYDWNLDRPFLIISQIIIPTMFWCLYSG